MMLKTGEKFQTENNIENMPKEIETQKDIVLKLDNFEGPLELLVYLIEKKRMKISEIKITQIIDEYLAILDASKRDHLDIKVEFVLIATELLEIKAFSVLNLEKERQSEKDLKRRLEEYKIFKEVTQEVSKLENEFNISYTKKGVVRETSTHIEVIEMISDFAVENGFAIKNLDFSPIKGPEGNIEYLIHLCTSNEGFTYDREKHFENIREVVERSHQLSK